MTHDAGRKSDGKRQTRGNGTRAVPADLNRTPRPRTPASGGTADGSGARVGWPAGRPVAGQAALGLRVQLPYFAARIAALLVMLTILLILSVNPLLAILAGLVIVGVLTYPLGRLQRRAAQQAAGRAGVGAGR
ncbi:MULTISPECIES: hypothetical protein [Protofrankia]|uniref:hypothetical protein n=1 Tax=Protofrankia TaxID=2994361 RepID=UPI000A322F47|nr:MULTISPECIES: hypothetical protein [Protofrankia]